MRGAGLSGFLRPVWRGVWGPALALLGWAAWPGGTGLFAGCPEAGAAPGAFPELVVRTAAVHVNDGDTFEADLNGNGRLELPGERVRLLYVDTPELHESHKGQDLKHGLPARAFLERAVGAPPLRLVFASPERFDRNGRTLAVVFAGKEEVNLALIRAGQGYFDTRFGFPAAYHRYAGAEGEAFSRRRGIWGDEPSRRAYLARLQREGKTPRSPANPLFHAGVQDAGTFDFRPLVGKFVRLRGRLARRRVFRRGARLLLLARKPANFPVFVGGGAARKVSTDSWVVGAEVIVEGFLTRFRGRIQMTLHHGEEAGK